MNHLYLAYGATWLIHLSYLSYLARRFSRLKKRGE